MSVSDLVDRLAAHKTVGTVPREELAWLVAHGTLRHLAPGEVLTAKGTPVTGLFLLLTGRIAIFLDRGTGRQKVMEWHAGDVSGMLPYSRLVSPPGDSVAQEPTEILAIPREDLSAMIRDCHEVTTLLVHKMLDRSRSFVSSGLQDEKMLSLGKLSAGLAHELNNPVSAIARNAAWLAERVDESEKASRAVSLARLSETQLDAIDALRASCLARTHDVLTPIQRGAREDDLADWLAAHHVAGDLAGPLADTAVTIDALDRIAQAIPQVGGQGAPLAPVLRSIAAGCAVRDVAKDMHDAARRISGLVTAIKGFTHMDQASVAGPVDLTASLGHTVAVLNAKAKQKAVAVTVHVPPDLPAVRGFVGELNQIWANLIDNALDAVPGAGSDGGSDGGPDGGPKGGRVEVTATHDGDRVIVRIVDNGPGIPDDVRARMFDPFFTTKPFGQGIGLGLDIVRRLIAHNDAAIDVETAPGRTTFRVTLPLADTDRAG